MRVILLAVGRMKAGPERDLLRRYLDRAQAGARAVGLAGIEEVEISEGRSRHADGRKDEEAGALSARLPAGAAVVVLDEHGRATGSTALARSVGAARDSGCPAFCFVIGGPDGLSHDLIGRYDALSFGGATFPHQLVRVLVAEQIYRVTTILAGHPYHRA